MRGVRFTKAERELLEQLLHPTNRDLTCYGSKAPKTAAGILAKLTAAVEERKGADVGPIQEALVKASRGKVLELEGGHAVASRRCADMKVTAETATLVGEWMARQGWLTGPMTLLDVLNKWYQWLPKARATQPPPAFPPGLGPAGATNGQEEGPGPGSARPGGPAQGRGTPQGFR